MQIHRATIVAFLLTIPLAVFLLTRRDRQAYALQELSAPGCLDIGAMALNNRREVVGWCSTASAPMQAILWQNGGAIQLGTLGGVRSHAQGINAKGQVVGAADTLAGVSHAFLWQQGRMRDLGAPGGRKSEANAINDRGEVVGWTETAAGKHHACLWQHGIMTDLSTLGDEPSEATAINNRGQVVGWVQTRAADWHAFLWQNGRMVDLGTLGGPESVARAINDTGEIVGYADTSDAVRHAFRYANGVMADLDARKDLSDDSEANGINAHGQIVGLCSGLQVDGNSGADTAFCLHGDRLELPRRLLPNAPGYLLKEAKSINDRGEIVANAVSDNQYHAFLLTPPSY